MDGKKWEDLDLDCLVNIFGRAGMESLLFSVPFACKSWYKATHEPQCWKKLVFPEIMIHKLSSFEKDDADDISRRLTAFVKSVVKRSNRSTTFLELPSYCTAEAFTYVANECPDLRTLILHRDLPHDVWPLVPTSMCKWKNLENLRLNGSAVFIEQILPHISIHCKNFVSLAFPRAHIEKEEASAIVTFLPSIKYLRLTNACMGKENLLMILQGCKDLEFLDIRECVGFEEDDGEILKLASHIRTFKLEGSSLDDYVNFMDPYHFRSDSFDDDDWA